MVSARRRRRAVRGRAAGGDCRADRYQAEDAAEAIAVTYEPLPAVASVDAALAPDAPRLYPDWDDNVYLRRSFAHGDVDTALAGADLVVRERFEAQRYSGVPLRRQGLPGALRRGPGRLAVWSSTQWPHALRTVLAELLDLPESRVRVVAPDMGGGFGNKQHVFREEWPSACWRCGCASRCSGSRIAQENLKASVHARAAGPRGRGGGAARRRAARAAAAPDRRCRQRGRCTSAAWRRN